MPIGTDKVKGGPLVEVEAFVRVVFPCELAWKNSSCPHASWKPRGVVDKDLAEEVGRADVLGS